MLRRSRVVLMDEATANIDMATDALIQRSIREAFSGSTVLTVAHRLDTVLDSDRIVVLDAGRAVDEGPVQELLSAGGPFAAMAGSLGKGRPAASGVASPAKSSSSGRDAVGPGAGGGPPQCDATAWSLLSLCGAAAGRPARGQE